MTADITPENVARMCFVLRDWKLYRGAANAARSDAADMLEAIAAERNALAARLAEVEADKRFIIDERDRTFALMLARAEAAEADIDTLRACAKEEMEKREAAEAREAKLREALTPSGDTKAHYSGEFSISVYDGLDEDDAEQWRNVLVDWTTIKAIMATIRARAALQENKPPPEIRPGEMWQDLKTGDWGYYRVGEDDKLFAAPHDYDYAALQENNP
jgi:hypothetical protein